MSDPRTTAGPPPTKYSVVTMVMMAIGFVLLLPGACALLFLPVAFEGYAAIVLPFALICFLISGGGIWMMVAARRSAIAAAQAAPQQNGGP